MMNIKFNDGYEIIQREDQIFIFQGLSLESIQFLRDNGMWLPITDNILSVDKILLTGSCQLYFKNKDDDNLIYVVTEYGEYMSGEVYDVIKDTELDSEIYLHTYNLYDDNKLYEGIQAVAHGLVFLNLNDAKGNTVSDWSDEDIAYILKPRN